MHADNPIEWNDSLQTGVAVIDDQHKVLVSLLNDANTKLAGEHGSRLLEQITRDLLAYAIYHFETEEELIKRYAYDAEASAEAEEHLLQHRNFSKRIVTLRGDLLNGKRISREVLLPFLHNWLVDHILHTDKLLAQFILAKDAARNS
ncbi:MAG TPA: bacteriohemerythrin [Sulfuricella sp.]|nr:bacteriohemerythrin [Sulfuricella sp.]